MDYPGTNKPMNYPQDAAAGARKLRLPSDNPGFSLEKQPRRYFLTFSKALAITSRNANL
jgi:hypothetical protein